MSVKEFFYDQDEGFLNGYFRDYIKRNIINKQYPTKVKQNALNQLVENWSNKNEKVILRKIALEFYE